MCMKQWLSLNFLRARARSTHLSTHLSTHSAVTEHDLLGPLPEDICMYSPELACKLSHHWMLKAGIQDSLAPPCTDRMLAGHMHVCTCAGLQARPPQDA